MQLASFVVPATIFVVLALGLNLQFGKTGLFNAGVAAFVGVGAYTFGMLATGRVPESPTYPGHWGLLVPLDLVLAAIVAMAVSGALGVLIALPTLRLRADYLAIVTLALAEIVRLVLKNERHLTGGDQNLSPIPRPFAGLVPETVGWASDGVFVLVALGVMVGVLLVVEYLGRSPWGRALRAVREDEEAAMALGKDTFVLKLGAFGIGCAIMGLAGVLLASFQRVILPDQFAPFATFNAYVIVILGGSGNNRGVILGGYVFWLFTWGTQQLKAYVPDVLALRIDFVNLMAIGVLLILFVLFLPEGIIPEERYVPRKAG
ncbi:MAG TPA: branched-chain amino acid ABC transporter permease [Thermoplasmata archaeon]|nr:branched-chain amino acid ABC transporter permease [Thermoplasmata archaeon]